MHNNTTKSLRAVSSESRERDYALDNIRFFLMFAVVFAHLLEVCSPFGGHGIIYKLIYTFHMPAFLFLFGCHATHSAKRIVYRWCIPYVVFQTVYILFAKSILGSSAGLQYTTPYWLLWYMLGCIFYQVLLPLYDTTDRRRQILALVCVCVLALAVGFDDSVGYYLSLSRFFVFQPWFLLGYYCRKNDGLGAAAAGGGRRRVIVAAAIVVMILSLPFVYNADLPNGLLYGSYSYRSCGGTVWMRLGISAVSLGWIVFLFVGIKPYLNRKLVVITRIGQNTWPVFLLHGFVVKAIPVYGKELVASPGLVLVLTCAILVLLGNRFCNRAIYYICFSWLENRPVHDRGDA